MLLPRLTDFYISYLGAQVQTSSFPSLKIFDYFFDYLITNQLKTHVKSLFFRPLRPERSQVQILLLRFFF